ncbi:MAG: hypothetical protein HYR85_09225 [Planctomycetes bacterium]|nr:hypothetical protein [Planctomycetota bacterium]
MRLQLLIACTFSVLVLAAESTVAQDLTLPGTQPNATGMDNLLPARTCSICHGFAAETSPFDKWKGSMMAQAARDPLMYAALAVANQDVPGSGEFCLRCHSPRGWLQGRSTPSDGSALDSDDQDGVQCIICHRLVDPRGAEAATYVSPVPPGFGNGMYVLDPVDTRHGPLDDATSAPHPWVYSPFHEDGHLCGTCHEVSNPLQAVNNDTQAPHEYGPVERTFSEWELSAYPAMGAAGQCQECHMPDFTSGQVCIFGPTRSDVATHDFMGANTWVPDILETFWSGYVDPDALAAGKARAFAHLQQAASLTVSTTPMMGELVAGVRVTNLTGHKLPTGYPEGRRMWLHVQALDTQGNVIAESGAYDGSTGTLTLDPQIKVYEAMQGLSAAQALATGLPEGPSFHFIVNDVTFKDNRIPPLGFDNAAFAGRGMGPVGATYADGQNWDDTTFHLPANTARVSVELLYQTASKDYIEFLRDTNLTNSWGTDVYNVWTTTGRSTPVTMASTVVDLPIQARAGNVNAGVGPVEDVLFVDGQTGDADRVTVRASNQPFLISINHPSGGPTSAHHATYFWLGEPTDANSTPQPLGFGPMVFPTPWTGGVPQPRRIANNLGHTAQLGVADLNSRPATSTVINVANGLNHPGLRITVQGFIQDRNSAATHPASITNANVIRIQ